MKTNKRKSPEAYIDGILSGNRILLSQAITLTESTLPSDQLLAQQILEACLQLQPQSYRLGITGVPGVGKSTFIETFGMLLIEKGHKVAVLAIDPSSQQSKGSILGDKTRMHRLSQHPDAFIRPSPTAGRLGGVARKTRESMLLCEAAGYDWIVVETVGVGQSETAVRSMVDFFLLLMLPNAGDDLQGIKKGIMEMADALVINKADGPMEGKAREAKANYSQALRLFPSESRDWTPPVLSCSALEGRGLDSIYQLLLRFRDQMQQAGKWEYNRQEQSVNWLMDSLQQELQAAFMADPKVEIAFQKLSEEVRAFRRSPTLAARELIQLWKTQSSSQTL